MFESQKRFVQEFFESQLFFQLKMTIEQFDDVLKDFITQNQLYQQGIDGDKRKLRAYQRTTVRIKISKGQPHQVTTLKDTGAFYLSIQVIAYADNMEIRSNVPYDKYLLDPRESKNAYGFEVLKPTSENMRSFMENYFLPNLKQYINDKRTR